MEEDRAFNLARIFRDYYNGHTMSETEGWARDFPGCDEDREYLVGLARYRAKENTSGRRAYSINDSELKKMFDAVLIPQEAS